MMVTVGSGGYQFSFQVGFHCLVCISLSSGAHLYSCFFQSSLGSSPNASADQHIYILICQQSCKSAVTGSVPVADCGSRRYNRLFFTAPAGSCGIICREYYDKSHLFFGGEQENYVPGKERKVFEYKGWKILPGICFDLRFPECIRNSGENPYDIYLNVANWPTARNAAADILLKARSIENACWSVFCNRTGSDPLLDYSGNSAVIDYRGRSRGKRFAVCGVPVVYGELEKSPMLRFREGFPVLKLAPSCQVENYGNNII